MTVRNRLEDAQVLATAGRHEGAFVLVLIAAAATSRKRYKRQEWDDGEAFKNFIHDEMGVITGGPKYGVVIPFQGKDTPLEEILYYHLRCQLVHEGAMPETIVFTEPRTADGTTCHSLNLGDPFGFPKGWIELLATAIWLAPENDDLWDDQSELRKNASEQLGVRRWDRTYCRRPGNRSKQQKGRDETLDWTHGDAQVRLRYPPSINASQIPDILEQQASELRGE